MPLANRARMRIVRDLDVLGLRRRREGRDADAQLAEMLAWQRERVDPKDRAESALPADEALAWHGVLVAEAYGPSHVPALLRAIEELGWDQPRDLTTNSSLPDWILGTRGQTVGGGFWPLNLTRERQSTLDTHVLRAQLPRGVAFARGMFLTPTPALTVLVLFFAFEDEPASRVEGVLRERTLSEGRRVDDGWVIDSVPNVKLDRVAHVRSQLRGLGGNFLSEYLPGAFATDLDAEQPACEVLTTKRWDPLDPDSGRDEERSARSYLWAVGLERPLRGWTASEFDGWRLELPDTWTRSPAMVLCAKTEHVTGAASGADPGSPTEQVSSLLFHRTEGVVALWACEELLRGYSALLGLARDEVRHDARGVRAGLKRLRDVRRRLLGDAADARTLAEELAHAAGDGSTRPWRLDLDFKPLRADHWPQGRLQELVLNEIGRRADVVAAVERRVRADLALDSEVVGATANLQAQRWVWALTALLGAVTIALAAYQIWG